MASDLRSRGYNLFTSRNDSGQTDHTHTHTHTYTCAVQCNLLRVCIIQKGNGRSWRRYGLVSISVTFALSNRPTVNNTK